MKIILTFKDPDALGNTIDYLAESERKAARKVCEKWFEYGEYCNIEIDTKTGAAKVLPVKD